MSRITSENEAPNNKNKKQRLRVALIGCGRVALKHAKAFSHLKKDLELIALADARPEACRALNDEAKLGLPDSAFFKDIRELYAQGIVPDITAITSPSGSHYELAKTALEHGSHVLIEKPMTMSLDEGRELLSLASRRGLKIAVGHIYRFFPIVGLVREDLAEGRFGRVLASEVKVHWGHGQDYYDQAAWRGTWARDGGALMNQTVHALDLMVWLLGSKPLAIQGQIARLCHLMEAEDYATALLMMDDGHILRVEGTTNTPEALHEASFYISTEKAEIYAGLRSGKPYVKAFDRRGKRCGRYIRRFLKELFGRGMRLRLRSYLNPHTGIYRDLAEAVRTGSTPRADGEAGLSSVEYVLAVYRSALVGGLPTALPMGDFDIRNMEGFFPEQKSGKGDAS